jgi:YD repeat-containing protein
MKNQEVAKAWKEGRSGHSSHMKTDGRSLWSYSLLIGVTDPGGKKVALNYTASGRPVSVTTSMHVNFARFVADRTVHPDQDPMVDPDAPATRSEISP